MPVLLAHRFCLRRPACCRSDTSIRDSVRRLLQPFRHCDSNLPRYHLSSSVDECGDGEMSVGRVDPSVRRRRCNSQASSSGSRSRDCCVLRLHSVDAHRRRAIAQFESRSGVGPGRAGFHFYFRNHSVGVIRSGRTLRRQPYVNLRL